MNLMETCDTCGLTLPRDKFNQESFSPATCFKCRVQGIGLTIPARSADVESWRHDTIRESNRRIVEEGRANGLDPVPVHSAAHVGLTGKQEQKIKETLNGV